VIIMRKPIASALLVAALALAAAAGYWMGTRQSVPHDTAPVNAAQAPEKERKVLYWYDPMYPQQRFDKPGKSPFMDMQLQPKYADEAGDEASVTISPRVVQNLGIRTAEAQPGSLAPKLTAVGSIAYNERSMVVVQPRVNGFIESFMCARRSIPCAKAIRWWTSFSRNGPRRRRNSSCCSGTPPRMPTR
jgi:Cu(I)/Ag(I) efflux system membrane fusion protein